MTNAIWRRRKGIFITYKQKELWDALVTATDGVITVKVPMTSIPNFHLRVWKVLAKRKHIYITDTGLVNITYEGKEFFALADRVFHRMDGICPRCGKNPLKVYSTGRKADHCDACIKMIKRPKPKPHPCKCGRGMAKQTRNGFVYSGCEYCQKERNQAWAVKRQAILRERIANGDTPVCPRCGQPVHVSASGMVYTYCNVHLNEIDRQRRKRQKARRFEEIMKAKS